MLPQCPVSLDEVGPREHQPVSGLWATPCVQNSERSRALILPDGGLILLLLGVVARAPVGCYTPGTFVHHLTCHQSGSGIQ